MARLFKERCFQTAVYFVKSVGRYGPFEADVTAGQMTKVEWRCDTGMR